MNYFVGYLPEARLATVPTNTFNWFLPPAADIHAQKRDEVFLLEWAKVGAVLVWLLPIGGLPEHASGFAVIPQDWFGLNQLPIPEHLPAELPQLREAIDDRQLYRVDEYTGSALHKISQKYLRSKKSSVLIGKTPAGKKKEKRQKTSEEFLDVLEKNANKRIGQGEFRDDLVAAYGGRCAITECSIDGVLSAAHIWDYSQSECQEAWNGILLRADVHLLFDRHLLRIFPGNPPIVVLDRTFGSPGRTNDSTSNRFDGRTLLTRSGRTASFDADGTKPIGSFAIFLIRQ